MRTDQLHHHHITTTLEIASRNLQLRDAVSSAPFRADDGLTFLVFLVSFNNSSVNYRRRFNFWGCNGLNNR